MVVFGHNFSIEYFVVKITIEVLAMSGHFSLDYLSHFTVERANNYNANYSENQKPLYVMIATDGAPTGQGETEGRFQEMISNERQLPEGIKISILACTNNDDEVGYLNAADNKKAHLDVTDDYRSEREEVQRKAPNLASNFTRPYWQGKIILGPIYPDFDNLDELATATDAKMVNKKFVFGGCFSCFGK
jgi:hypothetical protein